jgi:hypothetical protein
MSSREAMTPHSHRLVKILVAGREVDQTATRIYLPDQDATDSVQIRVAEAINLEDALFTAANPPPTGFEKYEKPG